VAKYTPESVERVKDAIDMVDLVGAKTELRRSGANRLEGLCPFHDERTPSFGIDPVQKVYHCFGCGAGGDAITFVMETEGVGFLEAVELLADRYGIELELADEDPREAEKRRHRARLYELLERTCAFYERMLWESREGERAREYLLGRGLTEEALRRFRVGYAPSAWDTVLLASQRAGYRPQELYAAGLVKRGREGRLFDMFRRRITFALADTRGRVIGFGARAMGDDQKPKYVNTPESELFHKRRQVYAAHLARAAAAKAGSVVVVEGYTDVVALHQSGIENAVAIMGTSMTDEQVAALKRLAPVAHLALDADDAGQEAMLRAARIAEREKLEMRIVPLTAGLDPADLVVREGPDAMRRLIDRSQLFVRFRVERLLAQGDVSSAEGKDRLLEDLKPVFRLLRPSILRGELVRAVADRLSISDADADALLRQPSRDPAADRAEAPAPRRRPAAGAGAPGARPGGGRAAPPRGDGGDPGGDRPPIDESMYVPSEEDAGAPPAAAPPRRPASAGAHGRAPGASRAPDLGAILARTEEAERRFLAFCLALPALGEEALAKVTLDEHFTSALTRRAAEHLRGRLEHPRSDLPPDDPELDALITELVVRAGREPATAETLEAQRLQLELRRIDQRMRAARDRGEGGIVELARARQEVKAQFDLAMERANAG
jgi:DNA primase